MTSFHATDTSDPHTNNQISKGKSPQPPFFKGGDEREVSQQAPIRLRENPYISTKEKK